MAEKASPQQIHYPPMLEMRTPGKSGEQCITRTWKVDSESLHHELILGDGTTWSDGDFDRALERICFERWGEGTLVALQGRVGRYTYERPRTGARSEAPREAPNAAPRTPADVIAQVHQQWQAIRAKCGSCHYREDLTRVAGSLVQALIRRVGDPLSDEDLVNEAVYLADHLLSRVETCVLAQFPDAERYYRSGKTSGDPTRARHERGPNDLSESI